MFKKSRFAGRSSRLFLGLVLALTLIATVTIAAPLQNSMAMPASAEPPDFTWEVVHDTPGVFYFSIAFPTDLVGYALGSPDWNTGGGGSGPSYISKTLDGGLTWTTTLIPGPTRYMRGLACMDENTCWISGGSIPPYKIMRTTDGGATWGTVDDQSGWSGWVWSAGWTGQGSTVMIGTAGYDPGDPTRQANFLRATDGYTFHSVAASDYNEFVQWDFSCPLPGNCYTAAKNRSYHTSDDGATWHPTVVPSGQYYGVACTDVNTCWLAGEYNKIAYTTNGGSNWQSAFVGSGGGARPRFYNIAMPQATGGFAVGCTNADAGTETCTGEGMIYYTETGSTWNMLPSPSTADIMDIHAFSMDEVIVIDWDGKIWRGLNNIVPPNPYDVNDDGVVNVIDIMLVAAHWNE
ncbi:MAG: hypothetical protein U9R25_06345 [Chloroflexota bacterium]|nr:hypothetical protein [Chloroflexota bacterium]